MKNLRFAAPLFVIAFFTYFASAQTVPIKPFTPARIAVVHSERFVDQKLGISKFLAVQKKINDEFGPTIADLQKLKGQIDNVEKEIRALPPGQQELANKAELFEKLKREFNFRTGEADSAMGQRYAELVKPVSDEVSKALADFAKKNGIDIVIDASKTGGVYVFNNAPDVTSQFVAFVNSQTPKP